MRLLGHWSIGGPEAGQFWRNTSLMELNGRRLQRGVDKGDWMAEETRPSSEKKKVVEACAHSARAICMASPISDAAYFTLAVKVLDYVLRLGIAYMRSKLSKKRKKKKGI